MPKASANYPIIISLILNNIQVDRTMDEVVKDLGGLDIMVISKSMGNGQLPTSSCVADVVDHDLDAGISQVAGVLDTTDTLWSDVLDTNLTGAMFCARAAGRIFREQLSGSLITTSSISAHIVNRPQIATAYNASKAALGHLTKSLAVEFAAFGARANSMSPSWLI